MFGLMCNLNELGVAKIARSTTSAWSSRRQAFSGMERTNSCGLKNLTFKQTKPFRATRQDDRDSFDRGASSLVSTAPRRIHAGRRLYCCPRSCVPGRPKPVGLSAAPVSIFERRYVTSGPSLQSHRAGAAEPRAPYRASDL